MKKNLILRLIAATLVIGVSTTILTSVAARATTNEINYNIKSENIKVIDDNTFEADGEKYKISEIVNSIRSDINYDDYETEIQSRNAATKGIKTAVKWVKKNWTKIYNKIPAPAKKYFKLDAFMSVADQFLEISDSIEDFFHSTFRAMGMPESVNWVITNVIMLLLPI